MPKPKTSSGRSQQRTASRADTAHLSSAFQTLQEVPDVWSGWKKNGTVGQGDVVEAAQGLVDAGNIPSGYTAYPAAWFRKALKNPALVELLTRTKAEMERASKAPLRRIVIHYRAEEPLYPSDEIMVHFSAHDHLRQLLVLYSRQGRIRPEHPEYPFGPEAFTRRVIKNPMLKA